MLFELMSRGFDIFKKYSQIFQYMIIYLFQNLFMKPLFYSNHLNYLLIHYTSVRMYS